MFERHTTGSLIAALADTPVAMLVGARQTGKSTIAQDLHAGGQVKRYVTFDDATVASGARDDPVGFLRALPSEVALDEIQRVPDLLLAIKAEVDRDRRPGRFLLTGSTDVIPTASESLAGRIQVETLWPLSQGEIGRVRERFIERAFGLTKPGTAAASDEPIVERLLRGGFPEMVARTSAARRQAWVRNYVMTLLQRDVRDLASIERLGDVPRLLQLVALRTTGILNEADLSRASGLPQSTVHRYLVLLERLFLILRIPAWHANLGQRLIHAPKVLVCDSAVHAHLLGVTEGAMARQRELLGPLLEGFVGMELVKQASWSPLVPRLHHLRTAKGAEIDFLLEDGAGRIVAVEVKASATVRSDDFKAMRSLRERVGKRLVRGIVLYTGDSEVPFGDQMTAWPIGTLWAGARSWKVAGGPRRVDHPGLDASAWTWLLEADGEVREVEVRVSGTAMAVDADSLPALVRRARETQGRSVVEELAHRAGDPPSVVELHSQSRLPQV